LLGWSLTGDNGVERVAKGPVGSANMICDSMYTRGLLEHLDQSEMEGNSNRPTSRVGGEAT